MMNQIQQCTGADRTLKTVCLASCRKLLAEMEKVKGELRKEFREALERDQHLLRLALNEAEALAWQSGVPQLIFPTLAREKAHEVATWHRRQGSLRGNGSAVALAA